VQLQKAFTVGSRWELRGDGDYRALIVELQWSIPFATDSLCFYTMAIGLTRRGKPRSDRADRLTPLLPRFCEETALFIGARTQPSLWNRHLR
jgi:hypothetical protein